MADPTTVAAPCDHLLADIDSRRFGIAIGQCKTGLPAGLAVTAGAAGR
jgi:hypothetical protein